MVPPSSYVNLFFFAHIQGAHETVSYTVIDTNQLSRLETNVKDEDKAAFEASLHKYKWAVIVGSIIFTFVALVAFFGHVSFSSHSAWPVSDREALQLCRLDHPQPPHGEGVLRPHYPELLPRLVCLRLRPLRNVEPQTVLRDGRQREELHGKQPQHGGQDRLHRRHRLPVAHPAL